MSAQPSEIPREVSGSGKDVMTMEDKEILDLYFARAERAIEETGRKYGVPVRRVARNILGSEQDAEECVDDTWLAAWNSIPPARPDPLLTYLCRICRNRALSMWRDRHARKRDSSFDLALEELEDVLAAKGSPEREYEARELSAAVNGFLAGLSPEDRFAFLRRYWYGDTVKAVAARLGSGEHRITLRLSRIRRKLKEHLEQEGLL